VDSFFTVSADVAIDLQALVVRLAAPEHLADAIIGDVRERNAGPGEVLRSLPPLIGYRASEMASENWTVALPLAVIICAVCLITIPFWSHLGMAEGWYHISRLFVIGLVLGCIPRASSLSCALLLVLIGAADAAIGAHNLWLTLLVDAASMAAAITALRLVTAIRARFNST
jgi:hypothetical protein